MGGSAIATMRLERRMHHCWVRNTCSKTWSASAKALSTSPRRSWIVERDVGVAPAGEMLEVGERAGRLQLVVDDAAPSRASTSS